MAEQLGPFEEWETRTFTCGCGWTGTGKETSPEVYEGLVALECPSMDCERSVAIIRFATEDEIRVAAADGNPTAIEMLTSIERHRRGER